MWEGDLLVGNNVHMECVWLVFSQLLQSELDQVKERCNSHCIRKSHNTVVGGVPEQLFFFPGQLGFQDCGTAVTNNELTLVLQHRNIASEAFQAVFRCNDELTRYFSYVIAKERLPFPPDNWSE